MHQKQIAAATLACCAVLSLLGGCGKRAAEPISTTPAATAAIIPAPRELVPGPGQFTINAATAVRAEAGSAGESVAQYFVDLVQRTHGLALQAGTAAMDGPAISFQLAGGESNAAQEGYSLVASPERIVVSASDSRGLFYGAVTLWQLMGAGPKSDNISIPAVTIHDEPRFRWRGLMLDSARHYQSAQFVKQMIDWMALHKLNVLHWHLTDDQAWRIEIRKYPLLTSVGAWRVPAGAAQKDIDPVTGRPRLYGGFYTQDQIRDIVAHAAQRHVTIVPEIETPGHASAAVAAYPRLGVLGEHTQVPADWGIYSTLYNIDDATFSFLEDVLTEVMALFPGEYIHMGGDEAVKDQWHQSPKVQAQMRKLGIKDEHALQSYFVQRIEKFLNAHGRKLIGWDEILEGGLAPNATVMSWRGIEGAVAAAQAGHDTVLSPWPTLYFDNRQADDNQPGRGRLITVEDVYRFDPAPSSLQPDQRGHILGVQANIWTEHMRSEDRVEYMTFPRAAALAEVAWSPASRINWEDFETRLPAQLARYDTLGIHYAPLSNAVSSNSPSHAQRGRDGVGAIRTSHELDQCTDKLVLSLEDDAPLQGERAVFLIDIMNPCWIWRDADLSQVASIKASVGQVPFNFQIGEAAKSIPLPKPQSAAGELEIRVDGCSGERIAAIPLESAVTNAAVTGLPAASIAARNGKHDLCFTFTRPSLDPTWAIDRIELVRD